MAENQFLVHINGNQNEIRDWTFEKLASDPTPFAGQFWENTTEKRWKWYDGTSVQVVANLSDITSAIKFKGGYDAATNTPNLDSSPAPGTILQGDFYYVTVAGTFYTEAVDIGDALIANVDNPASLSDWTILQDNVGQATETVAGIARIATQAEVNTGTDDTTIVTPLKLATNLATYGFTTKFAVDLDSTDPNVARVFAGGETTFTVTHGLGTSETVVQVYEISTNKQVLADIENVDANNVDVVFNGNVADGTYRTVIIG